MELPLSRLIPVILLQQQKSRSQPEIFSSAGFFAYKLRQRFRKLYLVKPLSNLLASCGTFFVLIPVNIYSLLN